MDIEYAEFIPPTDEEKITLLTLSQTIAINILSTAEFTVNNFCQDIVQKEIVILKNLLTTLEEEGFIS